MWPAWAASGSMPDWDAKYAAHDALFGNGPNEYVREICNRFDFTAQSALCLADGDGRNGTWLASQGLEVTAVDLSRVGTEKAFVRDQAAGVSVERIVADLGHWAPPDGSCWDAAFIIYLQCDPPTRERTLHLAVDALTPGGWLVVEAFAHPTTGRGGLEPNDSSVLYDLADIEATVPEMNIVEAFTGRVLLDEGARHKGVAEVVRYAGRKI